MRVLAYLWALPNTLLGLVFALGGNCRVVDGVVEIHNRFAAWFLGHFPLCKGAAAMTLGHVVIGQDANCLRTSRRHERIHVRQYETFGPFFIPLYFACTFHAWRVGDDPYLGNYFEVEAYRKDRA